MPIKNRAQWHNLFQSDLLVLNLPQITLCASWQLFYRNQNNLREQLLGKVNNKILVVDYNFVDKKLVKSEAKVKNYAVHYEKLQDRKTRFLAQKF